MPLATDELVRGVIDIDSSITDLSPFINAAASVVEAQCTGLTVATQTIVETWLSAHFVAIRDMRAASESAGPVSQSFQFRVDLGLNATMYGQQAMMLDTSGGLSSWHKDVVDGDAGTTVGGFWAGTGPYPST
jgi:hypothetical protein